MKSKFCLLLILVVSLTVLAGAQTIRRKSSRPKAPAPAATAPEADETVSRDRISVHQLKRKLDAKQPVLILDNRTGSSWLGSLVKIKGALHVPLDELEKRMDDLPRDVEIVTYCT